ncbi:MAG: CcdB family protein [Lysobacteraceae bacterium]
MNPGFIVAGVSVVLHPLDIATLPMEKLGPPVASLASCGDDVIAALDEVFTRAYG